MRSRSGRVPVAVRTVSTVAVVAALCAGCGASGPSGGSTTRPAAQWTRTGQGPVGLAVDGAGGTWVADADAGSLARLADGDGVARRVRVGGAPLRLGQ